MDLTRRAMILGSAALATTASGASQPSDSLQDWLAAHARAIRTVDPRDEDFADLEPIAAAIGKARVVQLGEPSHNAGTCFAAKARLIKFLHQRLKFDVVVWESGIYDVGLVEAGLRAGEDPVGSGPARHPAQLVGQRRVSAAVRLRPEEPCDSAAAGHGRVRFRLDLAVREPCGGAAGIRQAANTPGSSSAMRPP